VPLRALLTFPVVVSIANYGILATLDIAFCALQPLFYSTPIALGGLGFAPRTIGFCMGAFGLANGLFQALFLAKIIHAFGLKRVFCTGMLAFIPIFGLFPVMNALARRADGVSAAVWTVLAAQLSICVLMELCFGTIFVYITQSAPSKRTLGAVNGIAQTTASVVRAIGPATSTSLFSLSVSHNLLGGYAVYLILMCIAAAAMLLAALLPRKGWKDDEDDE
jgi:hypothetical protein